MMKKRTSIPMKNVSFKMLMEAIECKAKGNKNASTCDEDELEHDGPLPRRKRTDQEEKIVNRAYAARQSNGKPFLNVVFRWLEKERAGKPLAQKLHALIYPLSGQSLILRDALATLDNNPDERQKWVEIIDCAKKCYKRWEEIDNSEKLQKQVYDKLVPLLKNTKAYNGAKVVINHDKLTWVEHSRTHPGELYKKRMIAKEKLNKRIANPKPFKQFPQQKNAPEAEK